MYTQQAITVLTSWMIQRAVYLQALQMPLALAQHQDVAFLHSNHAVDRRCRERPYRMKYLTGSYWAEENVCMRCQGIRQLFVTGNYIYVCTRNVFDSSRVSSHNKATPATFTCCLALPQRTYFQIWLKVFRKCV